MTNHAHNGRVFTLQGTEPYTRKNGTETTLNVWHAPCARPGCAEPCVVKTPGESEAAHSKAFNRLHCATHALPMHEVRRRGAISQCKARAKVTDAEVAEIRAYAAQGLTPEDLALTYPLTSRTIREVIAGRRR